MILLALALLAAPPDAATLKRYPWLDPKQPVRSLEETFAPPKGFHRVDVEAGSFGAFLRTLPLLPEGTPVRAFDGSVIRSSSDPHVAAVAALDVGSRDLQQCADSVIRLHAEWKWSRQASKELSYRLTSGDAVAWTQWRDGARPRIERTHVLWSTSAERDASHDTFRRYLDFVFTYAGTRSLSSYATKVARTELRPGDFFVLPSKKDAGHAVLVLDVAEDGQGHRVALLGQGYMPAQSFHVLAPEAGQPWFPLDGGQVVTPFWAPFPWDSVRRLP